ncbi:MAG: hypothetical protein QXN96_05175 [Candidatus Bathyarchaeia archaeon]
MGEEQILYAAKTDKGFLCFTDKRLVHVKRDFPLAGAIVGGILGGAIGGVIAAKLEETMRNKKLKGNLAEYLDKSKKDYNINYADIEVLAFIKSRWSQNEMVKLAIQKKGNKLAKLKGIELYPKEASQLYQTLSNLPQLKGVITEIYE